ncbi:MAG TPA: MarR family transcriptional regulator, partial [Xanthobacteraceae bacterium]
MPARAVLSPKARLASDTQTAQAAAELIEEIGRISHSRGFSSGLNPAQWSALRFLARANPSARTATAFARAHHVTIGTATQTIAALVRKKCLKRVAIPEDRRAVRLDVTPRGFALLQDSDPLGAMVEAILALPENLRRGLIESVA